MCLELNEIKRNVRDKIGLGDTLGAINIMLDNEERYSISDANGIYVAKGEYIIYKHNYDRGLLSFEEYNTFLNRFNHRLLNLIDNFSENDSNNPLPNSINNDEIIIDNDRKNRVVLFDKNKIIVIVYEFDEAYDIIFSTSYTRNALFVKGASVENPRKYNITNLISYSKKFPFQIHCNNTVINYRLDVKFSYFTGLIKQYMLIRKNQILIEAEL